MGRDAFLHKWLWREGWKQGDQGPQPEQKLLLGKGMYISQFTFPFCFTLRGVWQSSPGAEAQLLSPQSTMPESQQKFSASYRQQWGLTCFPFLWSLFLVLGQNSQKFLGLCSSPLQRGQEKPGQKDIFLLLPSTPLFFPINKGEKKNQVKTSFFFLFHQLWAAPGSLICSMSK